MSNDHLTNPHIAYAIDVSCKTCFFEMRYDNAAKAACFYPLSVYKMKNNTLCYLYLPLNELLFTNALQRSRYPFKQPLSYFSIRSIRYVSVRDE